MLLDVEVDEGTEVERIEVVLNYCWIESKNRDCDSRMEVMSVRILIGMIFQSALQIRSSRLDGQIFSECDRSCSVGGFVSNVCHCLIIVIGICNDLSLGGVLLRVSEKLSG